MKIEIRSLSFDKVKDKYDYLLKEIDKLPENDKEIILDFSFLRWAEPIAMIYFGYQFRKIIEGREGIVVSIIEGTGKIVVTMDGWAYLNILFHMLLNVKILVMLKEIIPISP